MFLVTSSLVLATLLTADSPQVQIDVGGKLRTIQDVLQAVFPDLMGIAHTTVTQYFPFSRADWGRSDRFDPEIIVRVAPAGFREPSNDSGDAGDDQYLEGRFTVADEFIENAHIVGRRVRSREMTGLLAQAKAHPNWKIEDLDREITRVGGKYPSTEQKAFEATLPIAALRGALGIIRARELTFDWRQGREDLGEHDIVMPSWLLRLTTDDAHGRIMCYVLWFEPINGGFTGMIGNRCDPR